MRVSIFLKKMSTIQCNDTKLLIITINKLVSSFDTKEYIHHEYNRNPNKEWVNKIYEDQINYIKNYEKPYYEDNLYAIKEDGILKFFDGMHRIESMIKIQKENKECWNKIKNYKITIKISESNLNIIQSKFKFLNSKLEGNSSILNLEEAIKSFNVLEKMIIKKVCEYLDSKYKCFNYINKTVNPPQLNIEIFQSVLLETRICNEKNEDEIIEILENENQDAYSYMIRNEVKFKKQIERIEKMKHNGNYFYLGYYHYYAEDTKGVKKSTYANCRWLHLIFSNECN